MSKKTVSFITACEVLGISQNVPEVSGLPENYQKQTIDFFKANVIADAINKEAGWEPDWNNSNQYKYRPYFYLSASGWSSNGYVCWPSTANVGSRLVFQDEDDCEYAAEIFLKEGLTI